MSRADRMLAVLQDGRPHSRQEIVLEAGEFFLTNNAASELRARGYDVRRTQKGRTVSYQLVGVSNEVPALSAVGGGREASSLSASPAGTSLDTPSLFVCDVDESAGQRGAYGNEAA